MTILEALKHIIRQNNIKTIELKEFPDRPLLQKRVEFSPKEQTLFNEAMEIRAKYKIPFWDSLFTVLLTSHNYSYRLIKEALFHNIFSNSLTFNVDNFQVIEDYIANNLNKKIALSSRVVLVNSEIKHIPMLDFHIPISTDNANLLRDVISLLQVGNGFLAESGESYHFYGSNLLDEKELFRFLALALRFAPIIDKTWVSHQLQEKQCALRITKKNGILPKIISEI